MLLCDHAQKKQRKKCQMKQLVITQCCFAAEREAWIFCFEMTGFEQANFVSRKLE